MPKTIHRPEHHILATLLRELRANAGLTQARMVPILGRPQNRISDFERGGRRIDVIEFIDYCAALGLDPSRVFAELRRRLAPPTRASRKAAKAKR
ncbi:MAG: helix-turn-helix transcriptional regulator [Proteobacteria bacterium]|nr:helix-turn-helix transcriptional regulator [Pseudomonadota bacterium]